MLVSAERQYDEAGHDIERELLASYSVLLFLLHAAHETQDTNFVAVVMQQACIRMSIPCVQICCLTLQTAVMLHQLPASNVQRMLGCPLEPQHCVLCLMLLVTKMTLRLAVK